jgi:hypothetical protein
LSVENFGLFEDLQVLFHGAVIGGFGEDGDKTMEWIADRFYAGDRTASFEMSIPPSPPEGETTLYDGFGDPAFCDGSERLVA